MPSVHGQNHFIMEKQKVMNNVTSGPSSGDLNTFICTECGEGFSQYSNVLAHMTMHGPLESFSFDGSSNGLEIPREYVLQENGTLTVLNGLGQFHLLSSSHSSVIPASSGVQPAHISQLAKPVTSTHKAQSSLLVSQPRPSEPILDKSCEGQHRCEICNRSFNSLQSLHRHQQNQNSERGYKCTLCCKIYGDRQDLKRHLGSHDGERFHWCGHCGKRFLKVDALNVHQKENHSPSKAENIGKKMEKLYTCKKCELTFFWMSDFQTHTLYQCRGKELESVFGREMEIDVNLKIDNNTQIVNCKSNGVSYIQSGETNACKDVGSTVEIADSFTPYRCGLCGDRFDKLTALMEHHITHQTQEEIEQFNQEFQQSIKRRLSPKRGRRRSSNQNGKLHPCKHCHRVFNHSSSLSRHMRYHKGTMHTCTLCGRRFPQRCNLIRHLAEYHKTEQEKKPGLKYLNANAQNGPTFLSVDQKNTSILEDTKGSSDSDMTTDLSPKTGKAGRVNHKCQECGKKFGLLCVYQRHLRYHKKEPNKCPQCPAHFKNPSSLEIHLQNHLITNQADENGKQSFHDTATCSDQAIEKSSSENDHEDFKQNKKEDSSGIIYECTECVETFSCLDTFVQHQTSHGKENIS